ncbi:hypothetical protein O6H91_13G034400 [Diphasiastrum complanatum]|uniref:Uncharacterized protein n=1 Tax=Diphasiastrum complanatum TaxID=34168 RepID=A0ACC2BTM4_DIPCM|nr:hypothetical protein O6H91_13G034400 [Diphasiastrum complanatum]
MHVVASGAYCLRHSFFCPSDLKTKTEQQQQQPTRRNKSYSPLSLSCLSFGIGGMAVEEMQDEIEIVKAPSDKRQYEVLHLANGLRALLIHDPDIASPAYSHEGADAANIGSWSRDDRDSEHLCEDNSDGSEESCGEEDEELTGSDEDEEEEFRDGTNSGSEKAASRKGPDRSHSHCNHADGECVGNESHDEIYNENEEELDGDHRSGVAPTKKAAAALCVGVGSFSDPRDAQGLAHFLEHMLFMGSSKFPDENEYDNFLSKHGGSSNAFTETEFTCYHFDVSSRFLKPALDRFSQFFISPLVKFEAMEREVQAVDSEFDQVRQSDGCRLQQLRSHTADSSHPFHTFSWGNRESLSEPISRGVDMQEKLLGMCKEHYLANRMKLCVLGGEPLETLKAWVLEFFGEAREGGSERIFFPLERALWEAGKIYWVEAVKEQHNLSLTWILPCLEAAYLQKPQDYISHLIGHEGAGSLLSLLKAKGWASGLSAGIGDGGFERNTAAYMFNVSIDLTVLGLSKVRRLRCMLFGFSFVQIWSTVPWMPALYQIMHNVLSICAKRNLFCSITLS